MAKLTNLKVGDTVHIRCGGSIVVPDNFKNTVGLFGEQCVSFYNMHWHAATGKATINSQSPFDIISITPKPEPKRIKGWVNIYPSNTKIGDRLYNNRDEANINAHSSRFACIEIDVAEGEGL